MVLSCVVQTIVLMMCTDVNGGKNCLFGDAYLLAGRTLGQTHTVVS